MIAMHRVATLLAAPFVVLACLLPAAAADPASPGDLVRAATRIAVLGDSITQDGRWVADVAAWMEERGLAADVINVGLSSETVSGLTEVQHAGGKFPRPDLFDRLDSVLRVTKPDLVLAMYGMNCGTYLPLDEGRFAKLRPASSGCTRRRRRPGRRSSTSPLPSTTSGPTPRGPPARPTTMPCSMPTPSGSSRSGPTAGS